MDLALNFAAAPVTRTMLGISTLLAMAITTELVSDQTLAFIPAKIAQGEFWRIFTGLFFFSSFKTGFIITILMNQSYSLWLETHYYSHTKTYAWRVIVISVLVLIGSVIFEIRQPAHSVLSALEYITTRLSIEHHLLFFGLQISPLLIPFHHAFAAWLFQEPNTARAHFCGIAIGHVVLLLDSVYPKWTRRRLLALPGEPSQSL